MSITGPAMLNLPSIVMPIVTKFNDYKYFLLEGGRGSGKTQSVARLLSYLGEKQNVRIVCGREIQSTIDESVYTVFKDLIIEFKLNFSVYSHKIIHNTTGSEIKFKGFREQGNVNIKGMEGVDILWIDECQAITKHTLDIIVPTLRKEKVKIFFTMNRHRLSDPIYKMFSDRSDCLTIKVNYTDNPYINKTLLDEAEQCKINAPDDYRHIWLGEPMADADNHLFKEQDLYDCVDREFPYDPRIYDGTILGCDVARFGQNYSAGLVLSQCGPNHWEETSLERWKGQDAVFTSGKFNEMISKNRPDITIMDADGLGGPVYDFVKSNRAVVRPFHGGTVKGLDTAKYKNWRTFGYLKLSELVSSGHLRIKSQFIVDQLSHIQYKYDVNGRKYIIPKEQLIEAARKTGVPFNSPDEADALMMACTQINNIKSMNESYYSQSRGRMRGSGQALYSVEEYLL